MFSKLIRYIDSLFYTTTIVTTRRRMIYPNKEPVPSESPEEEFDGHIEKSDLESLNVEVKDDSVIIEDAVYTLPQSLVERPPLFINGNLNYESFPMSKGIETTITVEDRSDGRYLRFASIDGHPIQRRQHPQYNISRGQLFIKQTNLFEKHDKKEDSNTYWTDVSSLKVGFAVTETHVLFSIEISPVLRFRLSQPNVGLFDTATGCLTWGYGFSRAYMLTPSALGNLSPDRFEDTEYALIVTILGLMFIRLNDIQKDKIDG